MSVTDIRKYFNSKFRPPPQAGMMTFTYILLYCLNALLQIFYDDNILIFIIKESLISIFWLTMYNWYCYKSFTIAIYILSILINLNSLFFPSFLVQLELFRVWIQSRHSWRQWQPPPDRTACPMWNLRSTMKASA